MKILLAEDDQQVAGFIINGLSEAGHSVDHVAEAMQALTRGEAHLKALRVADTEKPDATPAYLPFDMSMMLTDTFQPTSETKAALQKAHGLMQTGDKDAAIEVLRLASVDIDISAALLPDVPSMESLKQATELIDSQNDFDANLALKSIEDSVIAIAVKRLKVRPAGERVLVLLTDGASNAGVMKPLAAADRDTCRIPDAAGRNGRLDVDGVSRLAQAGGGRFSRVTPDDRDISARLAGPSGDASAPGKPSDLVSDSWNDAGYLLVLLPVFLAPFAFRRGLLFALALMLAGFTLPATDARADALTNLLQTPDQQGQSAFEAGDDAAAAEAFESGDHKAATLYRAGEFEAAAQVYASRSGQEPVLSPGGRPIACSQPPLVHELNQDMTAGAVLQPILAPIAGLGFQRPVALRRRPANPRWHGDKWSRQRRARYAARPARNGARPTTDR